MFFTAYVLCYVLEKTSTRRYKIFQQPSPGWDAGPSKGPPQHSVKLSRQQFTGAHLYTLVERSTESCRYFPQGHNTKAMARNALCGVLCVTH